MGVRGGGLECGRPSVCPVLATSVDKRSGCWQAFVMMTHNGNVLNITAVEQPSLVLLLSSSCFCMVLVRQIFCTQPLMVSVQFSLHQYCWMSSILFPSSLKIRIIVSLSVHPNPRSLHHVQMVPSWNMWSKMQSKLSSSACYVSNSDCGIVGICIPSNLSLADLLAWVGLQRSIFSLNSIQWSTGG